MSVPIDPSLPVADMSAGDGPSTSRRETPTADILPYVLPMFAYVTLGGLESYLPQVDSHPSPVWYPIAYGIRAGDRRGDGMVLSRRPGGTCGRSRPSRASSWASSPGSSSPPCGSVSTGCTPPCRSWASASHSIRRGCPMGRESASTSVRLIGLVLLVPLIEELFWRSFLIRWLIDPDFRRVPIGRVTLFSAAATSVLFAVAHPEWLPALLTGLLWAWLLHQTRSLAACLISHVVANLALGIYVIQFGAWKFW